MIDVIGIYSKDAFCGERVFEVVDVLEVVEVLEVLDVDPSRKSPHAVYACNKYNNIFLDFQYSTSIYRKKVRTF